jgi:predicted peroxiredoxin
VRLLVNVVTGPENPTRAALGLLVARTAAEEGHEVRVFLAGDGVNLARPETAEALHGVGSGSVAEHWSALLDAGVPVVLSGLSSKARGIDAATTAGVELAPPTRLVELVGWSEKALVY